MTSYLAKATEAARDITFENWSESDLKKFLDSYGIPTYQGSNINELRAAARRNAQYFYYGTTTPKGTILAQLRETGQWLLDQLRLGASSGRAGQDTTGATKIKEKVAQMAVRIRQDL